MKLAMRGETIVEVALAFAIFSVAAMGTVILINNGVATTQRDLEITTVRQQVSTQAELLRYIKDTVNPLWKTIIDPSNLVSDPKGLSDSCVAPGDMTNGFFIMPNVNAVDPSKTTFSRVDIANNVTYQYPDTYAKIDYNSPAGKSQGIWVQATRAAESSTMPVQAYDFYVHACWDSVGVSEPITIGTIVRVYD